MGHFLIVSKVENLQEYKQVSKEYQVSFELNDFFNPKILDSEEQLAVLMEQYIKSEIPQNSTMHGAFLDLAIFSNDEKIRKISELRMEQSMEIAKNLGLKGVVFHTNYNDGIPGEAYKRHVIDATAKYLSKLLKKYSMIDIYVENMFEKKPDVLKGISEQLKEYPNYGVCLDWAHVNVYGEKKETWIEMLYPYVKHVHINDNDKMADLHLPIGTGMIDWEQFFIYYEKYFQNCSVLIELNDTDGQKASLDYIRKNFGYV